MKNNPKILIAYYSWSGNTRALAERIAARTGGDLFEIIPVRAYPSNYNACTSQAKREIQDGVMPDIVGSVPHAERYDLVFVGTPNWWSTMAPPVATFLQRHTFSPEATVIPFCTHGGGGRARIFSDMGHLAPHVQSGGLAVYGSGSGDTEQEVADWLDRLGIL